VLCSTGERRREEGAQKEVWGKAARKDSTQKIEEGRDEREIFLH